MRRVAVLRVLMGTIVLAACGETAAETTSFVVRDSAGVRIAESAAPAWNEDTAWRIGTTLVRIGVVDGDPDYQFSEVTGATRLSDGTIVVADGGSQQLRFFGPDGSFVRSTGGPGGGPGEFTGLSGLGRTPQDAIWAYDFSLRRLTWTDAGGLTTHIAQLDPEPPTLAAIGPLPDGTFVFKQLWGSKTSGEPVRTGLQREPTAYVRFDSAGALVDTLGTFPGRELFITAEKGRSVMSSPLLGRTSVGAVEGEALIIGDQESFRLARHSSTGDLMTEFGIPAWDLQITESEIKEHIAFVVESSPTEKQEFLQSSLELMPSPESKPAYGGLLVDRSGNLWVSEWAQYPSVPRSWTVLDTADRWLGEVLMPSGFFPWEIGSDWILGTETDELGVEYVALYSLVKAGSDSTVE